MFWALLSYLGPPELPEPPGVTRPPWSYLAPMELPGPWSYQPPWSYPAPLELPGPPWSYRAPLGFSAPGVTWAPLEVTWPPWSYPAPLELPGPPELPAPGVTWAPGYPAPGVTRALLGWAPRLPAPWSYPAPWGYPAPWSYPAPRVTGPPLWLAPGTASGSWFCISAESSPPRTSLHPSLCAAHSLYHPRYSVLCHQNQKVWFLFLNCEKYF